MANVSLNFKVPEALADKIKKEAAKKNIAMAAMCRLILSEYFEAQDKEK